MNKSLKTFLVFLSIAFNAVHGMADDIKRLNYIKKLNNDSKGPAMDSSEIKQLKKAIYDRNPNDVKVLLKSCSLTNEEKEVLIRKADEAGEHQFSFIKDPATGLLYFYLWHLEALSALGLSVTGVITALLAISETNDQARKTFLVTSGLCGCGLYAIYNHYEKLTAHERIKDYLMEAKVIQKRNGEARRTKDKYKLKLLSPKANDVYNNLIHLSSHEDIFKRDQVQKSSGAKKSIDKTELQLLGPKLIEDTVNSLKQ